MGAPTPHRPSATVHPSRITQASGRRGELQDLAWVAEGKLDASITLSNKPWDTAAGVIIAREAGAKVMDRDGTDHTLISTATVATTSALAGEIAVLIETANGRAPR